MTLCEDIKMESVEQFDVFYYHDTSSSNEKQTRNELRFMAEYNNLYIK